MIHVLAVLFFISLSLGQLAAVPLFGGTGTFYLHDLFLILLIIVLFLGKPRTLLSLILEKLHKVLYPIGFFTAVALLSLILNASRLEFSQIVPSSLYLFRWALYASLIILVFMSSLPGIFWIRGLYGSGVAVAVAGILQFVLYPNLRNLYYLGWDPHYYRLFSTFLDPNFTGLYLVLTLALGICVRQWSKKRVWITVSLILVATALVLTYSRSSYLAFITAVSVYSWFQKIPLRRFALGIIMFLFVITIIPRAGGGTLSLTRSETVSARIANWQWGLNAFVKKPIFGWGFNTIRYVERPVDTTGTIDLSIVSKAHAGVDNSFLFVLVATGSVGFISFLWVLMRLVKLGYESVSIKQVSMFGSAYAASLSAIFVHSFFVNSFFYPWILIWLMVFTGVLATDHTRK